jgi:hypothetical protein
MLQPDTRLPAPGDRLDIRCGGFTRSATVKAISETDITLEMDGGRVMPPLPLAAVTGLVWYDDAKKQ